MNDQPAEVLPHHRNIFIRRLTRIPKLRRGIRRKLMHLGSRDQLRNPGLIDLKRFPGTYHQEGSEVLESEVLYNK